MSTRYRIFVLRPGETKAQLGPVFTSETVARLGCTWRWMKDQKLIVGYFEEMEEMLCP